MLIDLSCLVLKKLSRLKSCYLNSKKFQIQHCQTSLYIQMPKNLLLKYPTESIIMSLVIIDDTAIFIHASYSDTF